MLPIPTVPDAESGQPVRLLPCPFCGSPATLEINETPDFSKVTGGAPKPAHERLNFHVRCSSPNAMRCTQGKHWLDSSAERAAIAWNRRAATVSPADVRALVKLAWELVRHIEETDKSATGSIYGIEYADRTIARVAAQLPPE